ncbi:MAG TPA: sigma-E factor negative regulatory protein [Albitalea sp.]|nr:sigma-E factor negative regulatory protein [Albitalea sp.]
MQRKQTIGLGALESDMSSGSESESSALESLSAMTDGELDEASAARACSAWREDASIRSTWHAYQLIGDVLRSDDLAVPPAHDAAFLAALRARLSDEPTVLAPSEKPAHGGRRTHRTWMAASAVAAGFVLVGGVLVVTRVPQQQLASAPQLAASDAAALEPQVLVVDGKIVRDARLDRYLAAHKQFAGSTALGVPSGFLRNAAAEAPGR